MLSTALCFALLVAHLLIQSDHLVKSQCTSFDPCPPQCRCIMIGKGKIGVRCLQGGVSDNVLNNIIAKLPATKVQELEISGSPERRNRFGITQQFSKFRGLKKLILRHGSLNSLGSKVFKNNKMLRYLDVTDNNITRITIATFEDTSHLQHLILDYNQVKLSAGAFYQSKPKLITLSLRYNKLTSISDTSLRGLNELLVLDLEGNHLSPSNYDQFLEIVPSLEELRLSNNKIKTFEDATVFKKATKLKILDLSKNLLHALSSDLAIHLTLKLDSLILADNYFLTIPDGILIRNSTLRHLSMSGNVAIGGNVAQLDSRRYERTKLKELDLSNTGLHKLPETIWTTSLVELRVLNLSQNDIGNQFEESLFFGTIKTSGEEYFKKQATTGASITDRRWNAPSITDLYLAETGLIKFPPTLLHQHFPNLKRLDVSHNSFDSNSYFNSDASSSYDFEHLSLRYCGIEKYYNNLLKFMEGQPLKTLDMRDNPWNCNHCPMRVLRLLLLRLLESSPKSEAAERCSEITDSKWSDMKCAFPSQLQHKKLIDLEDDGICSPLFDAAGISAESELGILAASVCGILLILILTAAVVCSYCMPRLIGAKSIKNANPHSPEVFNDLSASSSESSALHPDHRVPCPEKLF